MKITAIAVALLAPVVAFAAKAGQLYVRLNSASGLRDKDLFGKSDPFSRCLNPVYDQTFCFYVRPGQNKLYVRAVDKDNFSNDKIGDTSISLDQVMASGSVGPQDYNLPKWFGLLNLQMQFVEDKTAN
ncbi:hypothetical protein BGX29_006583 [Mortierella sp. GBA35]|nr:hypothetical protein BGX29_006583 [Mortierella sp. GBA35]